MALNLNRSKVGRSILLIVAVCGGLGAVNFFEPVTLLLNSMQSGTRIRPVSGDIVVVGIDSPSIREIGRWPWSRDVQAELIKQIDAHSPKAVYVDIGFEGKTSAGEDSALREALEGAKSPMHVVALAANEDSGAVNTAFSHPDVVGTTATVTAYLPYKFGYVWSAPTSIETARGKLKSVSLSMAGQAAEERTTFRIDYGLDPRTIPIYPAKDVLTGKISDATLKGKTVLIGLADLTLNDIHSMPGWREQPGVFFHVLGAETLKNGYPQQLGWLPLFLFGLVVAAVHLTSKGLKHSKKIVWLSSILLLAGSTYLTVQHVPNDPLPALTLIISVGIYVARQKAALIRALRNDVTGFADMTGYHVAEVVSNALFIAGTLRLAETRRGYVLDADSLKIMKEAGRRLSTVIDEKALTHNDEQQFLWEMPVIDTRQLAAHLEGLRRLFAAPLMIDGRSLDFDICFGVDRDTNAGVRLRMENALAASKEAQASGATFKIATAKSFEEHLTHHFAAEFDAAIANNDIALMFEPQMNLIDDQISGAELSLTWKHPAYGDIRGSKLYELAAKSNSTDMVSIALCKLAIEVAMGKTSTVAYSSLTIALSSEVFTGENFHNWLRTVQPTSDFDPGRIIFKIIDAAVNAGSPLLRTAIRNAKALGCRIAIGNFGTSNTDVDLIQTLKPDAIFLSKNFASELLGRKSYEIYVDSALRIARATNVLTVAESMDDRGVLSELKKRGCDRAQGKIVGSPLTFQDFNRSFVQGKVSKVG